MTTTEATVRRESIDVDGTTLSYLASGDAPGKTLLLLHGTFWSRVWQPVLPALGKQIQCVALDLPGFGRSEGELDVPDASVPALARTVLAAADALGLDSFDVAAHDIGGGIAQHLAATTERSGTLPCAKRPPSSSCRRPAPNPSAARLAGNWTTMRLRTTSPPGEARPALDPGWQWLQRPTTSTPLRWFRH